MKQGLFEGVDMTTYHADKEHVSRSMLMDMCKSPLHCYANNFDPNAPAIVEKSDAYTMGSMFHTAVLEPHLFDKLYVVAPKVDRRTNVGKAEWAEFQASLLPGQEGVSKDFWDTALAMGESVLSHPLARQIFSKGRPELSAYGVVNGVACRVRPDWHEPGLLTADLKSTIDASPDAFAKTVARFAYDFQESFYTDVLEAANGKKTEEFFFVVCEKQYPFATAVYTLTADDIQYARQEYTAQLERFAQCRASNFWPGYAETPVMLRLPPWRREIEDVEVDFV